MKPSQRFLKRYNPTAAHLRHLMLLSSILLLSSTAWASEAGSFSTTFTSKSNPVTSANNSLLANPPYTTARSNSVGTETLTQDVLDQTEASEPADWVLIEVHDVLTPSTIVARKAALLTRSGVVIDAITSASTLDLTGTGINPSQSYLVTLRHRHHLEVMTTQSPLIVTGAQLIDFTLPILPTARAESRLITTGDTNQSNSVIAHTIDSDLNGITLQIDPNNDLDLRLGSILLHPGNTTVSGNYVVSGPVPNND